MKAKETKSKKLVKVPENGLLSLVASKLKDRVLFPKKVEDAKKYLKEVKFTTPLKSQHTTFSSIADKTRGK